MMNAVLLPGEKRVPLGLLSCLRVPRPGSEPNREGESGALLRVSSASWGPGPAGLLFQGIKWGPALCSGHRDAQT